MQSFTKSVDLTVTGRSGKRHSIQIIHNDAFAPSTRIGPLVVSLEAGADDLAQLLYRSVSAAIGGMAEFFQLHRKRAAALHRHREL